MRSEAGAKWQEASGKRQEPTVGKSRKACARHNYEAIRRNYYLGHPTQGVGGYSVLVLMRVRVRALHGTYGQYWGHSSGHLAGVPKGCVRHYHSWYSEQEQQSEQEEAQAEINTERE